MRPLLGMRKADLLAYLGHKKQAYIRDPSNENSAYDRVKIRNLLPQLAQVGLTPERLARTAANMARAREYLEFEIGDFLQRHCRFFEEGYAVLDSLPLFDEIALRMLALLIRKVGGQNAPPRLNELERLYDALESDDFNGATLGGCIFKRVAGCRLPVASEEGILIFREPSSVKESLAVRAGDTFIWDKRFAVSCNWQPATGNYSLSALTQQGWLEIAKKYKLQNPCPDKRILYTLPCIRNKKGEILAAPHLLAGSGIACRASFIG